MSIWADTAIQELIERVKALEAKVAYLERERDEVKELRSEPRPPRHVNGRAR